jgi:hypothetical protein
MVSSGLALAALIVMKGDRKGRCPDGAERAVADLPVVGLSLFILQDYAPRFLDAASALSSQIPLKGRDAAP